MLQGDDTPPASPAQTEGQQTDPSQVSQPLEQQTEEEVEFNRLSGSSQERIRELVRRARDAENKLGSIQPAYVPPAPNTLAPDQRQAVETLAQFGIATDDKVDRKISEGVNTIRWEMENQRLQQKYSGSNGEPQYVREEVEDYIRNHPQYQGYAAEDVFKYKMFPDEFSNLDMQRTAPTRTRTSSLRPTKQQSRQDALTPEFIEERLKASDGQQWYDDNLDEINKVVANHTMSFKGKA